MLSRCLFVTVAILLGMGLLCTPQLLADEAVSIDLADGNGGLDEWISLNVEFTSLDLGNTSGVNGITLTFTCLDPDLVFGDFTPGPLLLDWMDATSRPPYPDSGWSYVNVSATDITSTGILGLLAVKSSVPDIYDIDFDITTPGVATEVAGGGITFGLTVDGGTVTVTPEPATLMLLGLGGIALLRRRK